MPEEPQPFLTDNVSFQIGHEQGMVRLRVSCAGGAIEAILTPDLARHLSSCLWHEADTSVRVDAVVQVSSIRRSGQVD